MIRNPGNTVITVEFTRKGGLPAPTAWDLDNAAQQVMDRFKWEYDLVGAKVTGLREEPGTVTLTAEEYDALTSANKTDDSTPVS